MKASISWVAVVASAKSARRRHLRLKIENQTSIKLNQDACTGRKWNMNVRCGCASSQLITSADQCELTGSRITWIGWPIGVCASSKASSSQNSRERCLRRTMPHTWPSLTRKPASRSTVPLRLYSNSRRAGRARAGGRRGSGGRSGAVGWRTPMPGFSSTQNSGPSVGGLSSSSMITTAFVANSGSRSFIQVSKTVQSELVPLEHGANGALAGMAETQFRMGRHVVGQVLDAPVGLAGTGRVNRRWLLTREDQQSGLDVGMVLARWRALGSIREAIQALLSEALTPHPDRPLSHADGLRNGGIGLAIGYPQNDLGAIRRRLGGGAGRDAVFQFGALCRHQPNSSSTLLGHVQPCLGSFPLQPGRVRINSQPASINRTWY